MRRPTINHQHCQHEATPAARRVCREAYWAKEAMETADATGTGPLSVRVTAEPYAKRAIVVNFVMKNGTACKVVFDRHGMNAELFNTALAYGWSAERTVAQACSEAISSVLKLHGEGSIERHSVHEVG